MAGYASLTIACTQQVPQSQFAADLELFQTHIRAQHAFLRRARHFKWAYLSLAVTCLVTFIGLFIYYKYIHDNDTTVPTWMVVILVVLPLLPLPIAAWLLHRGRQLRTEQKQRLRAIADELNSHTYAVLGAKWYVDLRSRRICLWRNPEGKPWVYLPVPVLELAVPLPAAHEALS